MPVGRSLASAESFEDEDVSAELSETVTERMANAIYVHAQVISPEQRHQW